MNSRTRFQWDRACETKEPCIRRGVTPQKFIFAHGLTWRSVYLCAGEIARDSMHSPDGVIFARVARSNRAARAVGRFQAGVNVGGAIRFSLPKMEVSDSGVRDAIACKFEFNLIGAVRREAAATDFLYSVCRNCARSLLNCPHFTQLAAIRSIQLACRYFKIIADAGERVIAFPRFLSPSPSIPSNFGAGGCLNGAVSKYCANFSKHLQSPRVNKLYARAFNECVVRVCVCMYESLRCHIKFIAQRAHGDTIERQFASQFCLSQIF